MVVAPDAVLPSYVSDALEGAQARLLGLLNLSLVFGVIACEAVVVLGLVGHSGYAERRWPLMTDQAQHDDCFAGEHREDEAEIEQAHQSRLRAV